MKITTIYCTSKELNLKICKIVKIMQLEMGLKMIPLISLEDTYSVFHLYSFSRIALLSFFIRN